MFNGLIDPRNYTDYTLMRGVTDFGNLKQYNLYESGYSFLVVVGVPTFLEKLADADDSYKKLLNIYTHVLENEFRGIDGLEDLSVDTIELTNGISTLNVISKVNMQSASTVSMRFFEKSGTPITRLHELYLKGLKDPRTQVKTYHGLIEGMVNGKAVPTLEAGYENEIFTFLYFVTDNTVTKVEKAYMLLAGQPTKAETSIFNSEKGSIETKEITAEFNCFPIVGDIVNAKAKLYLDYMNNPATPASKKLIKSSDDFAYTVAKNTKDLPAGF